MWGPRDAPVRTQKRIQLRHRGYFDIFLQLGISPRGGARADLSWRRAADVERSFTKMRWYVHLCACLRGKVGTINIAFYQMNEFRWIVTMFAGFPALNTVYVKPCMRFGWNTSSGAAVKILKGSTYAQKHTHVANNPNWLWKDVLKGNTVYRCDSALYLTKTSDLRCDTRKSLPGFHRREMQIVGHTYRLLHRSHASSLWARKM